MLGVVAKIGNSRKLQQDSLVQTREAKCVWKIL